MPYDFTTDGFSQFSENILNAGGDQATLTTLLSDMQTTITEAIAKEKVDGDTLTKTLEENERLRKANMDLFLRVGVQAAEKAGVVPPAEPEETHMDTTEYMKQYFERLDAARK